MRWSRHGASKMICKVRTSNITEATWKADLEAAQHFQVAYIPNICYFFIGLPKNLVAMEPNRNPTQAGEWQRNLNTN